MQEKRNIGLIISLLLLVTATAIAAWLNVRSEVVIDKNIFKVEDLKSIDLIQLESSKGKVELKFNGTRWMVNEKYMADRNLIDVLFATIQQAEPKRPVASSLKDSTNSTLIKNGVKVSLFSGDQNKIIFFAGGNKQKTQAYFARADKATPYIMIIPGYRVYASGIFELDVNGWRDKRIFNFNWRNFKSLMATFPSDQKQNFKVTFLDQYFGIEGVGSVDTTKLNNYLDAVSLLTADQFIEKGSQKYDSLITVAPHLIIEVIDVANRHYQLSVYDPLKKGSAFPGKIEEDQFVLFDPQKCLEILRKKDYFLKRD